MSELYKHDSWINPNILYTFSHTIYEYDMKNAGFNLSKAYHLLPDEKLESLERMKKDRRTIEIGKIQQKNQTFKNALQQSFVDARQLFFDANKLDDNDILSIKKDAIFVRKPCQVQQFLDYIEFRPKHMYTSYIRLNNRLELYYNEDELEVKGLGEEAIAYHTPYLIDFLNIYFYKMETSSSEDVLRWMRRMIDKYKKRQLDVGYYRRFQQDAYFDVIGEEMKFYEYWEDKKDELDISFNYFNVLIKLIKIPL